MAALALQLKDYRLTTAEILYHMPDHPGVLQAYIWQELDLAPRFPQLKHFLDFWSRCLDGKLHSVRVASEALIKPAEFKLVGAEFRLH
ncbi:Usg family protein [Aerophototrophica crusticola]|uniref:Usg family protein n=1 Tax=Aerophototrophica crusticola TaxID=1709002 RepID=A0A858RAY9_9PROT|nr:Usg family protein [Rhodospirillaceae bacterium B3]